MAYLADVGAHVPGCRQEFDGGVPFFRAEPDLAGEIVEVGHQAFEDVLGPWIGIVGVGSNGVFGDVVDREVHHWR